MAKFINNAVLAEQYDKIKYGILGSKTKTDAYVLAEKYQNDTKTYNLLQSVINGKRYEHALDYGNLKKNIRDVANSKYKEDAYEMLNGIMAQTSDVAQIRTLVRIADAKQNRPQYISMKELKQRSKQNHVTKKCPHCSYRCSMPKDTIYIVCGYGETGYDWEGCGNDWCFKCNKMLCKNWEQNQLYLPSNRVHDSKCCKKHAAVFGHKYPENYCRCANMYVARETNYCVNFVPNNI
jgi:hypothetical protein